jgi:hypothetical protein
MLVKAESRREFLQYLEKNKNQPAAEMSPKNGIQEPKKIFESINI